jgi:NhaA family Na+:H+ antiporter
VAHGAETGSFSKVINFIREYSIPLIAGVLFAVIAANVNEHSYHAVVDWGPFDAICSSESFVCGQEHGPDHGADQGEEAAGHDEHEASAAHTDDEHGDGGHADDEHTDLEEGSDGHAVAAEDAGHEMSNYVFMLFGHHVTLHFLINDIFMVFFFGVAAKEITQSVLPGGALNPPSKAVNPILGTLGGVIGPIISYLILVTVFMQIGMLDAAGITNPLGSLASAFAPGGELDAAGHIYRGWGVPTATDIALAWLIARVVFGSSHPAVNFLLLLAIADDAIGLMIIAIFYPNPAHPVMPVFLLLLVLGMAVAFGLRKMGVRNWIPYVAVGGLLAWLGLINASLHPALALVPIVPFIPADITEDEAKDPHAHAPLDNFEHSIKGFVDWGLIFFGFANAGVAFGSVSHMTTAIAVALLVGKTVGVAGFAWVGNAAGAKYPEGMAFKHVLVAGIIAGTGLTVALFVAGEAFPGASIHQGPAKMGALLSAFSFVFAIAAARMLGVKKV